jgi:hypothetical protein
MLRPIPAAESYVTTSARADALASLAVHCRAIRQDRVAEYVGGKLWDDATTPRTDRPVRLGHKCTWRYKALGERGSSLIPPNPHS